MTGPGADKPPTRRQLAAEQTRRKLLAVALDAFSRRPYAEVTIGGIARSAGVAHGLLSHHFNGKEGLYAEAVREAGRQLRAAQDVGSGEPPAERIRARFRAHLDFLAEHEALALNLILRPAEVTEVAWQAFESARRDGVRAICALLGLDADDPAVRPAMCAFTAAADELTLQWLKDGRAVGADSVVAALVELLEGALRSARALAPELELDAVLARLRG
ncbi:TetR/AcrR family transcriptional regulator [Streptomyces sp. NPDC087659]|uniref:TetR/AcrR family transcriptional regulator n=1 Tax=unclassified Streptomyces TaxID=2593676 RepID=UPI003694FF80